LPQWLGVSMYLFCVVVHEDSVVVRILLIMLFVDCLNNQHDMQPLTVVEGINAKDPKIQTWVYETFLPRILNQVKRVTHGSSYSDDITEDVFVVLLTREKPFESYRKIYQFAYRTATNLSIDHNKDRDDLKNSEAGMIEHFKNIEDRNRENAEIEDQYNQLMYVAGETLPRQCKQVFQQHYIYCLKNKQIGKKIGISKRTVETHISKAYQVLRIKVGKKGKLYIFSITLIL
jgi:RNA polymerase sigma-70 factor, ECF subfamily